MFFSTVWLYNLLITSDDLHTRTASLPEPINNGDENLKIHMKMWLPLILCISRWTVSSWTWKGTEIDAQWPVANDKATDKISSSSFPFYFLPSIWRCADGMDRPEKRRLTNEFTHLESMLSMCVVSWNVSPVVPSCGNSGQCRQDIRRDILGTLGETNGWDVMPLTSGKSHCPGFVK